MAWYNPLTWFRGAWQTAPISSPILGTMFGGAGTTAAGIAVNPTSALGCSAWWSGIRLLSESTALLPCSLDEIDGNERKPAPGHPVSVLLAKPCGSMTRFTFFQTLMNHVLSRGNAYAEIIPGGNGYPIALELLDPDDIMPGWVESSVDRQYRKVYQSRSEGEVWDQSQILHVPGLGFDGLAGFPVWEFARHSIALDLAAENYGASWFGSGGRPSGWLKYPGKLSPEAADNVRRTWREKHSAGSHEVALLTEGLEFMPHENDPTKAQAVEIRRFASIVVARFLRVPPHMLYEMSAAPTVNGLDQLSREYLMYSLSPWLTLIEEEVQDKLLRAKDRGRYLARFDERPLLRTDGLQRSQIDQLDVNSGFRTLAEIRRDRGLPFIPGTERLRVPLNYGTLREDGTVDNNGNGNGISNQFVDPGAQAP